jgi:hypothetical protein
MKIIGENMRKQMWLMFDDNLFFYDFSWQKPTVMGHKEVAQLKLR